MNQRVLPLLDARAPQRVPRIAPVPPDWGAGAVLGPDRLGRALRDLRISVTDRCNFRCVYCMPKERFGDDHDFVPHAQLLRFEEIARLARILVAQGVRKIRLTGGEPLLRRDVQSLVGQLAQLRMACGAAPDLALTTNGALLARKAPALAKAGLRRVTVSLDALDDTVFRRMNDVGFPVADVLAGIDAAVAAGFAPIKINMVVKRGWNEDQILPLARWCRQHGHVLRFIEFMDVGTTNGWARTAVVPSEEVLARLDAELPLEALAPGEAGAVAQRWRYRDGSGEIGTISSVTRAFCGDCTRARLSTEGVLYLCLFARQGFDLRALLRGGASDAQIAAALAALWAQRADRYSELRERAAGGAGQRIEMSYIGG